MLIDKRLLGITRAEGASRGSMEDISDNQQLRAGYQTYKKHLLHP
jgi:hypothetical protein